MKTRIKQGREPDCVVDMPCGEVADILLTDAFTRAFPQERCLRRRGAQAWIADCDMARSKRLWRVNQLGARMGMKKAAARSKEGKQWDGRPHP